MGFELNADGVVIVILVLYAFFGSFYVWYRVQKFFKWGPFAPVDKGRVDS